VSLKLGVPRYQGAQLEAMVLKEIPFKLKDKAGSAFDCFWPLLDAVPATIVTGAPITPVATSTENAATVTTTVVRRRASALVSCLALIFFFPTIWIYF
jgi:hypothetical protein